MVTSECLFVIDLKMADISRQSHMFTRAQMCFFFSFLFFFPLLPPEPHCGPGREADKDFVMKLLVNLTAPVLSRPRHKAQNDMPRPPPSNPPHTHTPSPSLCTPCSCHIFLLRLCGRGEYYCVFIHLFSHRDCP